MTKKKATRTAIAAISKWDRAMLRLKVALVDAERGGAPPLNTVAGLDWLTDSVRLNSQPKRGRGAPPKRVTPWTAALAQRKDTEIAEAVEHWRAYLAKDRANAEKDMRLMASDARKDKAAILRAGLPAEWRVPSQADLDDLFGEGRGSASPFEIAKEIVAWLKGRTPATVTKAITRARKAAHP